MRQGSYSRMCSALIAAIVFLLLVAGARADVITKTNGQKITGTILKEDDNAVTVQYSMEELLVRVAIPRKDIAKIEKEEKTITYCRIPIQGSIGEDVKAEWLAQAFSRAKDLHAAYIVLCFDSGGGDVYEMEKIIELIKKNPELKLIAHVKRAASAAAMIAMTCRTIVVTRDGGIGAAVPFKITEGRVKNVDAKFMAYFESTCRSAAEFGGHSPLLVRGMMEMDLVLSTVSRAGGIDVVEGEIENGTVLKKAGHILMVQGQEVVDAGLAVGVADDLAGVGKLSGIKAWQSVGDSVWTYMLKRPTQQRELEDASNVKAAIAEIEKKLEALKQEKAAAEATMAEVLKKTRADAEAVDAEYKKAMNEPHPVGELDKFAAKARARRQEQIDAIKAKYKPQYDEQVQKRDAAALLITVGEAQLMKLRG